MNVVNDIYQFRKRGTVYAILSAPAFIAVEPDLMREVLKANHVSKDKIALCLDINSKFREKQITRTTATETLFSMSLDWNP